MKTFTASNGVRAQITEGGSIRWAAPGSETFGDLYDYSFGSLLDVALAEFYRAREDDRVGRWRFPDDPTICVYLDEGDALVVSETEPGRGPNRIARRQLRGTEGMLGWGESAARAYFDAHPAPKPWHEAKLGDVWVMAPMDAAYTVVGGVDSGSWFTRADVFGKVEKRDLTDDVFTTGTLVWRGMNR